jgi:hypothetical protein
VGGRRRGGARAGLSGLFVNPSRRLTATARATTARLRRRRRLRPRPRPRPRCCR